MALRINHTETLEPSGTLVEAFGQIYDLDNGAVRLIGPDNSSLSISFDEVARLYGICYPSV